MRVRKREVKIGNVTIGGANPIAVQTMLNVPVEDIQGNVAQARRCEAAGCQLLGLLHILVVLLHIRVIIILIYRRQEGVAQIVKFRITVSRLHNLALI